MVQTKLNVLHLHLTDSESFLLVLKTRSQFSQIAFSSHERYTKAELTALAAFAKQLNVRLGLELDEPKHVGNSRSWYE